MRLALFLGAQGEVDHAQGRASEVIHWQREEHQTSFRAQALAEQTKTVVGQETVDHEASGSAASGNHARNSVFSGSGPGCATGASAGPCANRVNSAAMRPARNQ